MTNISKVKNKNFQKYLPLLLEFIEPILLIETLEFEIKTIYFRYIWTRSYFKTITRNTIIS